MSGLGVFVDVRHDARMTVHAPATRQYRELAEQKLRTVETRAVRKRFVSIRTQTEVDESGGILLAS